MANASGAVNAALRPIAALNPPSTISAGQNVGVQCLGQRCSLHPHVIESYAWSVINGTAIRQHRPGPPTAHHASTVVAPSLGSFTRGGHVVTDDAGQDRYRAGAPEFATATSSTAPASAGHTACIAPITPTPPITVTVSPSGTSVQAGIGTQALHRRGDQHGDDGGDLGG
jgi:hypothetical protein